MGFSAVKNASDQYAKDYAAQFVIGLRDAPHLVRPWDEIRGEASSHGTIVAANGPMTETAVRTVRA